MPEVVQANDFNVIVVSSPLGETLDFVLDVDVVAPRTPLLAGTCAGAQTPSLFAAAFALPEAGTVQACPGIHPVYSGLRFPQRVFTLRGAGVDETTLQVWQAPFVQGLALGSGLPGSFGVVSTTSATISDLTVKHSGTGIAPNFTSGGDLVVERAEGEASTRVTTEDGFERIDVGLEQAHQR